MAMRGVLTFIPFLLLPWALASCAGAPALWERGSPQDVTRHTLKELRDAHVVKQARDYSCGAAALATLLTYYFGDETSERQVLDLLEGDLTEEEKQKRRREGFSLLDLKRVAEQKGYRAGGFKLTLSQLAQVAAPVVIFVEPFGYKHFAVYRGFDRGRVFLADPSRGNLRMSLGRFQDEWSGIVFVLGREGEDTIEKHLLSVPQPEYVQPELARMNGQLDLGMMIQTLPQR